uniref:Uncharacterized protein n=1 Tax=Chromera velia CCMP2878 TaxID=1169474 RepID=A0A0G4HZZ5_9ALVE|eukprot:Cvel_1598.t1-p1 / transcript=Cvel_1598.t1 / gene=Cvel_1598 / organism=Chromera_velia_CCMP2878 / gene_product=hypothetical protein / transcript_product=hypothetical protein / location=Cvel_scaffold57:55155-57466(-) / protein_length=285 / sequence_SO=supercontig / SO=protein_coding / is_pseudo=false
MKDTNRLTIKFGTPKLGAWTPLSSSFLVGRLALVPLLTDDPRSGIVTVCNFLFVDENKSGSRASSAPPSSYGSGGAAASHGARGSGSGGAASSRGARGGRIGRLLGTTGFACDRCRHRFPTRADLEEVTLKVCKQCLSTLRSAHTDVCTSPEKRIRTKRRVVEAFAQPEGDHSPLESAGDSPMAGDSPGGDGSPPAFLELGLAAALYQSLSAAAAAAANAPTMDHPHGPSPHVTGSMRLVHSPYLKAWSPGGSAMRSPQGRHFEYVGLRQDFRYLLLEWITAEHC